MFLLFQNFACEPLDIKFFIDKQINKKIAFILYK